MIVQYRQERLRKQRQAEESREGERSNQQVYFEISFPSYIARDQIFYAHQNLFTHFNQQRQQQRQQPLHFISTQPKPELLGKHQIDEVRELLREWTRSHSDNPEPEDAETVQRYVVALVEDQNMEMAQLVLMYLVDLTGTMSIQWRMCIRNMAETVDEVLKERYGGGLKLLE